MIPISDVNTLKPGSIEEKIAEVATRYHLDQQGRAPKAVRAHLVADMAVVYSAGIYTPTEQNLESSDEGRKLIKSARRELRSITRKEIEARVSQIVGRKVLRSFWDMDVRSGEQVEVYMLGPASDLAVSDA